MTSVAYLKQVQPGDWEYASEAGQDCGGEQGEEAIREDGEGRVAARKVLAGAE